MDYQLRNLSAPGRELGWRNRLTLQVHHRACFQFRKEARLGRMWLEGQC